MDDDQICDKLLDMQRMIKNRVWQQRGPEALAEIERKIRTCPRCDHESDQFAHENACPICGYNFSP